MEIKCYNSLFSVRENLVSLTFRPWKTYPTKNPLLNRQILNLLSLVYAKYSNISQRRIFAGSAITCPTPNPANAPRRENSFINSKKIILGVNNVGTNIKV